MDSVNAFYASEKSNSLNDVTEPNQILVCSTGDTWDVAVIIHEEEVETHWFEKKSHAVRAARRLFNDMPEIKELGVEGRGDYEFKIIRTR
tara:strand:+ start:3171 stop:3440 length:270 start_codon:yes stop_codon:yes gene_type:complete